jgi:hypothetical protein
VTLDDLDQELEIRTIVDDEDDHGGADLLPRQATPVAARVPVSRSDRNQTDTDSRVATIGSLTDQECTERATTRKENGVE